MKHKTKHETTAEERQLCWEFAGRLMRLLANPQSDGNAAAASLTSHGITRPMQTLAKLAEITFCKWACLDYRKALNWEQEPDDGVDATFASKQWDIKHTEHGSYLLWPYNKVLHNPNKKFDTFALVIGGPYEQEIIGWCTRHFFERNFISADEIPGITNSTPILHRDYLSDMTEALSTAAQAIQYGKVAEYVMGKWP
jgi:hypothetical protein